SVERAVAEVAGLLVAGKARAWGVAMWPPAAIEEATRAAAAAGIEGPCAAQMAYSVVNHTEAESQQMVEALRGAGAGLVASAALEGGLLTGKYDDGATTGRLTGARDDPARRAALDAGRGVGALGAEWGTWAAALAVAFVFDPPSLASALVGATAPAQLDEVVAGI